MISVVNLRHTERCMRVDRATKWGNPYSHKPIPGTELVDTRWDSVLRYIDWAEAEFTREDFLSLDGLTLGCWCAPALCHGNALQLLGANAKGSGRRWVLISGEAPRKGQPIPPSLERRYRELVSEATAELPKNAVVVHGGAPGIDSYADEIARARGLDVVRWPADWKGLGKSAGPERNKFMLERCPIDEVWAFHRDLRKSAGTADMVRRAQRAHVDVELFGSSELRPWWGPLSA
jgi:hypothetical protein